MERIRPVQLSHDDSQELAQNMLRLNAVLTFAEPWASAGKSTGIACQLSLPPSLDGLSEPGGEIDFSYTASPTKGKDARLLIRDTNPRNDILFNLNTTYDRWDISVDHKDQRVGAVSHQELVACVADATGKSLKQDVFTEFNSSFTEESAVLAIARMLPMQHRSAAYRTSKVIISGHELYEVDASFLRVTEGRTTQLALSLSETLPLYKKDGTHGVRKTCQYTLKTQRRAAQQGSGRVILSSDTLPAAYITRLADRESENSWRMPELLTGAAQMLVNETINTLPLSA